MGLSKGFKLNYYGPRLGSFAGSLVSGNEHKAHVAEQINKEVYAVWVMSQIHQYQICTFPPKGLVPKSNKRWRMITHMCHPPSLGINAFIDQQLSSVKYSSFESVVDITAGLVRVNSR